MKKTSVAKCNVQAMKSIAKQVKPQVKCAMDKMTGGKNPFDKKTK